MKRWQIAEPVPPEAHQALFAYPRLLASLLWRRGVRTADEAAAFLGPSWERDVHDPFRFRDMRKAVSRLLAARERGELIIVHGDYDADGVSGSVILHSTLKRLGAISDVYLPHREKEGYGISEKTVRTLAERGAKVMITTDCGISNAKEIAVANELGIDVIITDHHTLPPELPAAHAILHPLREGETYPFRHLTGGGVAFKLAQALWKEAALPEGQEKWLLDMVSISTVADMGALVGENRAFVHYGLQVLAKTRRLGLSKLVAMANASRGVDAGTIGFQIAPRINAAGRMDHALGAFALLTSETEEDAVRHAAALDRHNLDRREATERIVAEARLLAKDQGGDAVIIVSGQDWPAALCGLVAARLMDDRYRPAIALGRDGNGRYVGSGRSVAEYDITAALRRASGSIAKFGGHPRACGLTIEGDEAYGRFHHALKADAEAALKGIDLSPRVEIEEELALEEATLRTAELIRGLEPHGEGNARPKFLIRDALVSYADVIGKEGKHLRFTLAGKGGKLKLVAWNAASRPDIPEPGSRADFVIELDVNEWNGVREPQGKVVDFRPA